MKNSKLKKKASKKSGKVDTATCAEVATEYGCCE